MEKLIYASRETRPMAQPDLLEILQVARPRNEALGLSGMLLYSGGGFLQVLEGDPEPLDAVWASLQRDRRHQGIQLLTRELVLERRFSSWSMGFDSVSIEQLSEVIPGAGQQGAGALTMGRIIRTALVAQTVLEVFAHNGDLRIDSGAPL